jgi:hypothetical protein
VGELKLTVDQIRQIRDIKDEAITGLFSEPPDRHNAEEFEARLRRAQTAEVENVLAILTPEQTARWKEMTGKRFEGSVSRRGFFGPGGPGGPGPPKRDDRKRPSDEPGARPRPRGENGRE